MKFATWKTYLKKIKYTILIMLINNKLMVSGGLTLVIILLFSES